MKSFLRLPILFALVACSNCGQRPFGPTPPTPEPTAPIVEQGGAPYIAGGGTTPVAPVAGAAGAAGNAPYVAGGAPPAITWPICDSNTRKLAPQDVERYRRTLMPARPKQMRAHPKAAYQLLDFPDRFWMGYAPALDQNKPPDGGPGLGSCAGNAATQWRVNQPWLWAGTLDPLALERLAISVYSDATKIDPFPGSYPPDDTGSNGESVMTVLQKRGLVAEWHSVYTFAGLQRELQQGPCIMGSNWYTGMFSPSRCGEIQPTGVVEGGHQTLIAGLRYGTKQVLGRNSWGDKGRDPIDGWGVSTLDGLGGYFWLSFGTLQRLIDEGADFACGVAAGIGK